MEIVDSPHAVGNKKGITNRLHSLSNLSINPGKSGKAWRDEGELERSFSPATKAANAAKAAAEALRTFTCFTSLRAVSLLETQTLPLQTSSCPERG